MSAPRLSAFARRSRRTLSVRLARTSRKLREIAKPKLGEITPEIRALIAGDRGVF